MGPPHEFSRMYRSETELTSTTRPLQSIFPVATKERFDVRGKVLRAETTYAEQPSVEKGVPPRPFAFSLFFSPQLPTLLPPHPTLRVEGNPS